MKLLLVFVSALVLVAHGYGAPSEEFAEEAPGIREFGAEEEPIAELDLAPENGVYIPSVARACNNAACANVCHRLGFIFGICTSPSICWCRN
ncbi:hypothetical protein PYW07_015797 [Mythimna separata]|uniref:Uncharacterized protein n=1 Tax=Mythimna separata TaxID=271217 RepID=A0AAD8DUR5_MYTSE|nr:hypothetical protein PYW07_015797 [Mythimna separata]